VASGQGGYLAGEAREFRRSGDGTDARASRFGRTATIGHDIYSNDTNARTSQQANEDLSDQSETDNACGLAQSDISLTQSLESNRANGGERGLIQPDAGRNRHAHHFGHPIVLGVKSVLVAGTGDCLPDAETFHARANLDHHAGERVSERRV
jgi:NADPH-dependent 2,4-dienoyl-CoA reductase/sulfur reductase-like enzyme